MIELKVAEYCENCPDFEAHVEKYTSSYHDFDTMTDETLTYTQITCEYRDRCRCMKDWLAKQKGEKL